MTLNGWQERLSTYFAALRSTLDAAGNSRPIFALEHDLRIPVKWASDSGDVGRSRSEATLVVFYVSKVDHMRSRKA